MARAERDANLAEMRIRRALRLEDDPGDVRAVGQRNVAYRRHEGRVLARGKVPLDDGRLRAGAEGDGKARMRLAGILHGLDFERSVEFRAGRHVDDKAVAHEGAVDAADRVVGVTRGKALGGGAVGERVGEAADRHGLGRTADVGSAVDDGKHRRAFHQRRSLGG